MAISYNVHEEHPDRLVFREKRTAIFLAMVFTPIGGIAFFIGLYLTFARDYGEPLAVPAIIATSFGLAFGAAGVLLYVLRDGNPHEFVFDNQKQGVRIRQRKRGKMQEVTIPYRDIARFAIRTRMSSSSSSSGGTQTRTYHIVFWQKHDSSIWDLREFTRRKQAKAFCQYMEDFLERKPDVVPPETPYELPATISRTTTQTGIQISWRNTPQLSFVIFLLILMGFWGIDCVLLISSMSVPFFILTALLTLISALIVVDLYKNLTTKYALRLSKTHLAFLENGKEKKHLLMKDIAAVNFDLKDSIGGTPIRILTHSQLQGVQRNKQPGLDDVLGLLKSALTIFRIKIDGLTVVEKVQLEHFLQQEMTKLGARPIY